MRKKADRVHGLSPFLWQQGQLSQDQVPKDQYTYTIANGLGGNNKIREKDSSFHISTLHRIERGKHLIRLSKLKAIIVDFAGLRQ